MFRWYCEPAIAGEAVINQELDRSEVDSALGRIIQAQAVAAYRE